MKTSNTLISCCPETQDARFEALRGQLRYTKIKKGEESELINRQGNKGAIDNVTHLDKKPITHKVLAEDYDD